MRRDAALLAARRVPRRIWAHDPTVFVADGETNEVARKSILSRLGWLRSPEQLGPHIGDVLGFAADVRARGFTRAVLLGMGGSSLCPEVLAKTFGPRSNQASPGIPVEVLDSTDPDAVAAVEAGGDPDRTLFVVASKSGGTIEVASFENHFWRRAVGRVGLDRARKQFCAITDLNTELHLPGPRPLPPDVRQPQRHRRALLGAVAVRAGPGGPAGHRREGAGGPRPGDGPRLPEG